MLDSLRPPLRNALWLVAPIFAWNLVFFDALPESYADDRNLPALLVVAEHALRVLIFAAPLWMALPKPTDARGPYLFFALGTATYIGSWLPWILWDTPAGDWPLMIQLAPAYTPLLWLLALGWLSRWRWYQCIAGLFVIVHVYATYERVI